MGITGRGRARIHGRGLCPLQSVGDGIPRHGNIGWLSPPAPPMGGTYGPGKVRTRVSYPRIWLCASPILVHPYKDENVDAKVGKYAMAFDLMKLMLPQEDSCDRGSRGRFVLPFPPILRGPSRALGVAALLVALAVGLLFLLPGGLVWAQTPGPSSTPRTGLTRW